MDHLIGSIETGKYADFAVLENDPLECPVDAIKDIPVWGHNCGRHSPSGKGKKRIMATQQPVTFTVIGGFLGAGKTSNRTACLPMAGLDAFAVMVNDFGALNIDESLITENDGQVYAIGKWMYLLFSCGRAGRSHDQPDAVS